MSKVQVPTRGFMSTDRALTPGPGPGIDRVGPLLFLRQRAMTEFVHLEWSSGEDDEPMPNASAPEQPAAASDLSPQEAAEYDAAIQRAYAIYPSGRKFEWAYPRKPGQAARLLADLGVTQSRSLAGLTRRTVTSRFFPEFPVPNASYDNEGFYDENGLREGEYMDAPWLGALEAARQRLGLRPGQHIPSLNELTTPDRLVTLLGVISDYFYEGTLMDFIRREWNRGRADLTNFFQQDLVTNFGASGETEADVTTGTASITIYPRVLDTWQGKDDHERFPGETRDSNRLLLLLRTLAHEVVHLMDRGGPEGHVEHNPAFVRIMRGVYGARAPRGDYEIDPEEGEELAKRLFKADPRGAEAHLPIHDRGTKEKMIRRLGLRIRSRLGWEEERKPPSIAELFEDIRDDPNNPNIGSVPLWVRERAEQLERADPRGAKAWVAKFPRLGNLARILWHIWPEQDDRGNPPPLEGVGQHEPWTFMDRWEQIRAENPPFSAEDMARRLIQNDPQGARRWLPPGQRLNVSNLSQVILDRWPDTD